MNIVLREAGRLNQLVTRFLEYSRPPPLRREDVDLSRVVAETLEVFANDPAASRIQLETSLEPAPAWCDPDQARQVLWNLLLNAAQASQRDGRSGNVRVESGAELDGSARLTVEDDGPGIAPADLEKIFTPFFTTREKGTGLGLATVQRIVDGHGGTVSVDSAPGAGTRFTVRLPVRASVKMSAAG
jgi:two-component system sensor histidine kinase PilS (NtrC family)